MKKFAAIFVLLLGLFAMQGCLLPPNYGCVENYNEVIANPATIPLLKTIDPNYAGYTIKSGDFDCSKLESDNYCIVTKVYPPGSVLGVNLGEGIKIPGCFDESILGDECEFGCSYYVCTPYSAPQGTKESKGSEADGKQVTRLNEGNVNDLGESLIGRSTGFFTTPRNFLHMDCRIVKLDAKTFNQLKKADAVFSTFRLGFGKNFDDFEYASTVLPSSSSICGLNAMGGVDSYVKYFSPEIKTLATAQRCIKNANGFWTLPGYLPEAGNRINLFSTFAECMLNNNAYYLKGPEKEPFVAESFCYSQDYTEKLLPFLDSSQKLYSYITYSSIVDLSTSNWADSQKRQTYDVSLGLIKDGKITDLQSGSYANQNRDRFVDKVYSQNSEAVSNPAFTEYGGTLVDPSSENYLIGNYRLSMDGVESAPYYRDYLERVPEYYSQFEFGSYDRQGRVKTGAEFECIDGSSCLSQFCDKQIYSRYSCIANQSGTLFEVPCGCTVTDCNHFYSNYRLLGSSSPVPKYLTQFEEDELHPRVLVLEDTGYGTGVERFKLRLDDNSAMDAGEKIFWTGTVVKNQRDNYGKTVYYDSNSACNKKNDRDEWYLPLATVTEGSRTYDLFCQYSCDGAGSIKKENPFSNSFYALSLKSTAIKSSSVKHVNSVTKEMYVSNFIISGESNYDFEENIAKGQKVLLLPYQNDATKSNFFAIEYPNELAGVSDIGIAIIKDDAPSTADLQAGQKCLAIQGGALLLDLMGSDWFLKDEKEFEGKDPIPLTPFNSGGTFLGRATEDYYIGQNSNFVKIFKYIAQTSSQVSKDSFAIYKGCNADNQITGSYCANPYLMQSYGQAVFENPLSFDATISAGDAILISNWYNSYKNNNFCSSLSSAKYFCTGQWMGSDSTGTCNGDMAVAAYIFKENIADHHFGQCLIDESSVTGLKVQNYGWCESCSVFNLAFDTIESQDFEGYPLWKEYWEETANAESYSKQTGAIYEIENFKKKLRSDKERKYEYKYFKNPQYATFVNPITGKETFSGSVLGDYNMTWKRWKRDCYGAFGCTSWHDGSTCNDWDEDCMKDGKGSTYRMTGEDSVTIAGVYTYQDLISDLGTAYSFETSPAFTEDDFYPSRNYLYQKVYSYLNRGILPVLIADDNELYKKAYSTSNDPVENTGFNTQCGESNEENNYQTANCVGPDADELYGKGETGISGTPHGADIENPRTVSFAQFSYKVLRDIQDMTYSPDSFSGFSSDNQGPLGGALVLTNKMKVWPTGAGAPRSKVSIGTWSSSNTVECPVSCSPGSMQDECWDWGTESENRAYFDYDGDYIANNYDPIGYEELCFSYEDCGSSSSGCEQDCDHNGVWETCTGPCENVPACAALLASSESTTKRGLVHVSFNGDIDDASSNANKLTGLETGTMPGQRMELVKDEEEGCPTCQTGIFVEFTDPSYRITGTQFNKMTDLETAFCGFFAGNFDSLSDSTVDPSKYYSKNPCGCLRVDKGVATAPAGAPKFFACGGASGHSEFDKTDTIILSISVDASNLDDEKVQVLTNNLIQISSRLTMLYGKPIIYYIKSLNYNTEQDLNLLFSYLNFRKSDLISAGTIGLQFEDARSPASINSLEGTSSKNFYLVRPAKSSPSNVYDNLEGYCSVTRNLLPIVGLINIKGNVPMNILKECSSPDCIDVDTQCLDESAYDIKCTVKRGDGLTNNFNIIEYNETLKDFSGLSLSQTGYSFCPKDSVGNPQVNSVIFKTLPVPSIYAVPITFSQNQDTSCYPSSVTPQELSEIFTSGIKFATCYPVLKNPRENDAPTITIINPATASVSGEYFTVSAEASDPDGIEEITIRVSSIANPNYGITRICSNQNHCSVTSQSFDSGNYLFTVVAEDIYQKTATAERQFSYSRTTTGTSCEPCSVPPSPYNNFNDACASFNGRLATNTQCSGPDISSCPVWNPASCTSTTCPVLRPNIVCNMQAIWCSCSGTGNQQSGPWTYNSCVFDRLTWRAGCPGGGTGTGGHGVEQSVISGEGEGILVDEQQTEEQKEEFELPFAVADELLPPEEKTK